MVDTNTSADTEENNDIPYSDMSTDMIQLNDSVTVSTMTNDVTTLTGTENNQVIPLSILLRRIIKTKPFRIWMITWKYR